MANIAEIFTTEEINLKNLDSYETEEFNLFPDEVDETEEVLSYTARWGGFNDIYDALMNQHSLIAVEIERMACETTVYFYNHNFGNDDCVAFESIYLDEMSNRVFNILQYHLGSLSDIIDDENARIDYVALNDLSEEQAFAVKNANYGYYTAGEVTIDNEKYFVVI